MGFFRKKWTFWLIASVLGLFWAYGFTTRINLLFITPLWLKAVIMLTLGANLTLLAGVVLKAFTKWSASKRLKVILLLGALILSGLILLLTPYHPVPFRTTHTLTIQLQNADLKIVEVLSPDDNLIERSEFTPSGDVIPFDVYGFQIASGGQLGYQRSQTGGLTLVLTSDSGPFQLNWDNESFDIDPATIVNNQLTSISDLKISSDSETGRISLHLPGHTWGNPDLVWSLLGGLLPVADFICLSTILVLMAWSGLSLIRSTFHINLDPQWVRGWLDAAIIFSLAMLLINVAYPDFIPGWFLFFFLPAMIYLFYKQLDYYATFTPALSPIYKLSALLEKISAGFQKINQSKWMFWTLIAILALSAAFGQWQTTQSGMGISGDSVHYINATENLAAGNGYVRTISAGDPIVMTGFPPVYSFSLLPGVWTGLGIETYARYQNLVLLALTILLIGWLVYRATGKTLPAIWTAGLIAMAPSILDIYSWVMSEPLFFVLLLLNFILLGRLLKQPKTWLAVVIGGIAGIATLTRLVGLAFIPVLALAVLIFQETRFKKRLINALALGFSGLAPVAVFFIRNSLVATQVSESRGFTIAPFKPEYWEYMGAEITKWFKWERYYYFAYQQFNALFATLGVILLLIVFWLIFRKKLSRSGHADSIIISFLIAIPAYLALIVLNTIFLTPNQTTPGLSRYMIPLGIITFISLGKILHDYWHTSFLFPKLMILFVLLLGVSYYYQDTISLITKPPLYTHQYTDRKQECGNELQETLAALPTDQFFTNNCEYFYFMTGLPCNYISIEAEDYAPDGTVMQTLESGTILAYVPGFGSQTEELSVLLGQLDLLNQACSLDFYTLPEK